MSKLPPIAETRKGDYFWVDSRRLIFEEGYNEREKYPKIEELADSIRAQGVKQPLTGFKRGDQWIVKSGHRRTMACRILEAEGEVVIVPIVAVPRGLSAEEKVLDLITDNDQVALTPWEQAKVLRRLRNFMWSEKDIVERSGLSTVYVRRLLSLADAPQELINLVREERVSATFAMDTIAEGKESIKKLLEKARSTAGALVPQPDMFPSESQQQTANAPKPQRITKSDLRPYNSWKIFTKWAPKTDENRIPPEKAPFFQFLQKLRNGELSELDFQEFFQ